MTRPLRLIVADHPPSAVEAYFRTRGWKPFAFQREVWAAMRAGRSGLLHATTGAGKTLAVGFGALGALGARLPDNGAALKILWITPMRALAADTARSLEAAFAEVGDFERRPAHRRH